MYLKQKQLEYQKCLQKELMSLGNFFFEKISYWLLYLKVEMRKKHRDGDKILLSSNKARGIKTKVEISI